METLNQHLFLLINAQPNSPQWLLTGAAFIADYIIYLVPLGLVVLWLWTDKREIAIKGVMVAFIALGIGQLIGLFYQHPRPFMLPIGYSFAEHAPDTSFPSDHAIVFFALSVSFYLNRLRLIGLLLLALGLVVAWSRVYLGIHFPLDMVGALGVVIISYWLVAKLWGLLGRKLMLISEKLYQILFALPIAKGWIKA